MADSTFNQLMSDFEKDKKTLQDRDGIKFHDLPENRYGTVEFNENQSEHRNALKDADAYAESIIKAAYDHTSPSHKKAYAELMDQHDGLSANVHDHYRKEFVKIRNAYMPELRNAGYENSTLSNYRISSQQDQAMYNKFSAYIKAKWTARGYRDDDKFIADFWSCHPMPGLKSQSISS